VKPRVRSRRDALVLLAGLIAVAAVVGPQAIQTLSAAPQPGDLIADFTDVRQRIDGFGASDRKNPLLTDADADLFFSMSRGIGLSMLRASVDPNGQYFNGVWANATRAAARGAVVWAAPWSPPAAWKDNNDVNNGGHLLPAYYDAWASQLANFAALLQQNAGVPLYGVSVQNEPDYQASYNSALYTPQQMVDFIKVLGPKLAALNPRPKLISPDVASWGVLWNYSDAIMADPVAASYTDVLATHQYFAPDPTPHAIPSGKTLWQTEMSGLDMPSTNIANGITVARWVHNALVNGSVNAWHYWWLIGLNNDNEGLLNIGREPTKRLYTFGNFSKFIRPGFVRVGTTGAPAGVYATAYKDPVTNTIAVVAVNDSGSNVPLGVALNGTTVPTVTPWVTSATEDLAPRAPIAVSDGRFTMTLPAASVTTFVSGSGVPPSIASVSPLSGATGTVVTVTGSNFGATQGTSTIRFNGADATPASWSDTTIVAPVPADASTGSVVVAVNGVPSNGVTFTSTTNAGAYVFDIFNGANGALLGSHLPNTGGTWVDDSPGNRLLGNRLESTNYMGGRSRNTAAPPSPDYEVSVDVTMNVTGYGNKAGVEGRVQNDFGNFANTKYEAYFSEGSRTWHLDKWLGGNAYTIGTFGDAAFTSGTKKLKLAMVGTTITVYVNGSPVIGVSDSSIGTTGYAGIFNQGGIHNGILLDNYLVTAVGSGTPQPPATPTSPYPANGATGVSTSPTLTWTASGASTYDLRFGTTTPPPLVATVTNPTYSVTSLAASTTYYWQIVARNNNGATTGPVWSFITAAASPTPSIASLSPTSGTVGTPVTISGANFGSTQGTTAVTFNGTAAAPTSWSASTIVVPVPSGATTGPVVVTVNGVASNGVTFTVNVPSNLPAPWASLDIGTPAAAGQASYSGGTFTVSGAGVDIWDVSDQFRFVYQTIDGDGEIVARVGSLQQTDVWAKAGVMIRQDLAGDSPNAVAQVTAANGMIFQRRDVRGGLSASIKGFAGAAPQWIRVVRAGNEFRGYCSVDGVAWTLMGSFTIAMPVRVYIGLSVTSHNPSVTTTATFSNVSVTNAPAANQSPALTQPADQTSVEGAAVSLQLMASDPDGDTLTYSATGLAPSLSVNPATGLISGILTSMSAGTYSVTATASDGMLSNSKTFTWTVTSVIPVPSITGLSPTSGLVGTSVTISGANFGSTQGTSTVSFNGRLATPVSWSAGSILVPVPTGATTGQVVVTVNGVPSNGVTFTVNVPSTLPAPWASQDVGFPVVAGQATYAAGTFTVLGAGVDIWDVSDQFRFVYRTIDGDGEIVARVGSLLATDVWAKAGVMIRQDLAADSPNVVAQATAASGMVFQRRETRGGLTASVKGFLGAAPAWVRVSRAGNVFRGYYWDGAKWTLMGTVTIPMPVRIYIGLSVTGHNPALLTTATFTNVTVTGNSTSMQTALAQAEMSSVGNDYDGDGRADMATYRPANGEWRVLTSHAGYAAGFNVRWGGAADLPVAGDYDGDRKADVAYYRPSTGTWSVLTSRSNYTEAVNVLLGAGGDTPVPGDYDGDGITDIAVYTSSTGQWRIRKSSTRNATEIVTLWGAAGDVPVPGDFDGDRKSDIAVYRRSTGEWRILESSRGYASSVAIVLGGAAAVPAPADYDGDGIADAAVYYASTGMWQVRLATGQVQTAVMPISASASDVPVPGDYDGDGRADFAAVHSGAWQLLYSSAGYKSGVSVSSSMADVPVGGQR
jgi:O-glycosyl hydrolase